VIKDGFHEELYHAFDQFSKYHMKILLHFNAKIGREGIFKLATGNEGLHEIRIDNSVTIVNFSMSKYLSRAQYFYIATFINTLEHLQVGRHTIRLIMSAFKYN
jgi:hypothetical protein